MVSPLGQAEQEPERVADDAIALELGNERVPLLITRKVRQNAPDFCRGCRDLELASDFHVTRSYPTPAAPGPLNAVPKNCRLVGSHEAPASGAGRRSSVREARAGVCGRGR